VSAGRQGSPLTSPLEASLGHNENELNIDFYNQQKYAKQNEVIENQPQNISWIDKYRPKVFDDIVYQDEIKEILRSNLESLPHLLFYGCPGSGKTSLIMIIARHIYGNSLKNNVLILNASQDRGIDVVRNKIKLFAQKTAYTNHPFKLIILDEADSMTPDAQSALRRILEHYSKITRFCFICNYVTKMIDPIVSRCSIIRFKPIKKEFIQQKLEYIAKNESLINFEKYIPKICELTN